jgi:hypothetical protein
MASGDSRASDRAGYSGPQFKGCCGILSVARRKELSEYRASISNYFYNIWFNSFFYYVLSSQLV